QIVQIRESGASDIEQVEKEVAGLKRELNKVPAAKTATAEPAPKQPAPKKEVAVAPVKKQPAPAPAAAPKTASPPSVTWELRAAQPGRAWGSRQGQKEMQSVEPGVSLSGIGQITRIDYSGGRWVVT